MLTKEQLEERLNYLGASDAAGVLGLSRWMTPLQIWAYKTKQIPCPDEETLPMWVGMEMEDIVAKRFMKETGKKVRRVNDTIYHKQYPFLACHVDRKVEGEGAILQCKTATAWKAREWEGEEIPQEYIIQEYHELACTGHKKAYIACLIGNHKFVVKEIEHDNHIINNLISKEVYFWQNYVEKRIMPAQISCADSDILYQLFPIAQPESYVELDDDINIICENIEAMKEDLKSLQGKIGQQENILKAMLKDSEAGATGVWKVTWKNRHTNAYTVPAKDGRVLRINKIKEE